MTAARLHLALAAVLLATLAIRSTGLLGMLSSSPMTVEMARWTDREFSDRVEAALGDWLEHSPAAHLSIRYVDDPSLRDRARLTWRGREAIVTGHPSKDQLVAVLRQLKARVGAPRRLLAVATSWPSDQEWLVSLRRASTELGLAEVTEVSAARSAQQGSPTLTSGPGDWLIVGTEAAREHLRVLVRSPGRKVLFMPPYAEARERSHPDLWFVSPWNPDLEMLPGASLSSCAAGQRLLSETGIWPVSHVELQTLVALTQLLGESVGPPPLTLVGPPASGGGGPPVPWRDGPTLPRCQPARR